MEAAKKKLEQVLLAMFQLDCADLDFGMYRVLNLRRAELTRFLRDELLPQVEAVLRGAADDRPAIEAERTQLAAQLRAMGMSEPGFAAVPKWQALTARLEAAPDVAALAREVFSDLTTFFGRYYEDGDFLALPRYKGDTYAVPYGGEEVKLHWANADQYYAKSTEMFGRFVAKLAPAGALKAPALELRVVAAESDRGDNKANQKRRFVLRADDAARLDGETLTALFEYRLDAAKQDDRNEEAAARILAAVPPDWQAALSRPAPHNKDKTTLRHQIDRYTRRQTSDYFIHKDLGGFLRRELDFFLKNEVLHLDDVEGRSAAQIDEALKKIKASRAVGHKLIDWLAQIEGFQKRLFLKKKLVLRTEWCVTLDRVPPSLHAEIAANAAQREAWARLFGEDFGWHAHLPVDTRHFDAAFKRRLLCALGPEDADVLIQGNNFDALGLLSASARRRITHVFSDPPYNTGNDGFAYKDNYPHSTWLSCMADRLRRLSPLLAENALVALCSDFVENAHLRLLVEDLFGPGSFLADVAWEKRYTRSNNAKKFYSLKDTLTVFAPTPVARVKEGRTDKSLANYSNPDDDPRGPWISSSYVNPATKAERPNLVYPLVRPSTGERVEHPTHAWKYDREVYEQHVREDRLYWGLAGDADFPRLKTFLSEASDVMVPTDLWHHRESGTTDAGGDELKAMFGAAVFDNPKPTRLVQRFLELRADAGAMATDVLDFFAGSGTTGHAVIQMNRADGGGRRFTLVEMGEHFDTVLVPRILKATAAREWKDGRPVDREGISACYKLLSLESYDDALENLDLRRDAEVDSLLRQSAALREDYTLRYLLDLEAKGSLLDRPRFRKPFGYRIATRRGAEVVESPVDLVETFNHLLGLRVQRYADVDGLLFVEGTDPHDARVLVAWRDCDAVDDERLNLSFRKAFPASADFDVVYVNGDSQLAAVKDETDRWRVELIEEAFHDLMFADAE